eukprot:TRINITY_DN57600_c0_g1_i1.p1 TRINITY_DN57600_c0_g1~~TRINITY_DN57600_c0_g1_i1.p1  ORF type:complete len:193 (+),score=9.71 TRINITY_DN57600_c0_g1_i1:41-619(+)
MVRPITSTQTDVVGGCGSDQRRISVLLTALRTTVRRKQKALQSKSAAYAQHQQWYNEMSQDLICLDIGGEYYWTSKPTLLAEPDTLFEKMFSGAWSVETQPDGSILVDHPSNNFDLVLQYLRDRGAQGIMDELWLKKKQLTEVAAYFSIDQLAKTLQDETHVTALDLVTNNVFASANVCGIDPVICPTTYSQ